MNLFSKNKNIDDSESHLENVLEYQCNDCNLVQILKDKQAVRKEIYKDIESYNNKKNIASMPNTIKLCISMEKHGFIMDKYLSPTKKNYKDNITILEEVLKLFSFDDIDNVAKELKGLKQRGIIINEKKMELDALDQDIVDIKMKLGIE